MPLNDTPVKCGARTRNRGAGARCRNDPMTGQKRCRLHGGSSPQAKAKVERDKLEAKITRAVQRLKITPVHDPLTELQKLAGEALAWKEEMRRHVRELSHIRYRTESEQVRAEVVLYERAIERLASILATIAKLNIDERLAAITERQAAMMEAALFAAFEAAGIGLEDVETKRTVVAEFTRHLSVAS